MLKDAIKLTRPDVLDAVRHGFPLPKGVSGFSKSQWITLNYITGLLNRKENNSLHGYIEWNRNAVEIIYNWCLAYRGLWDDLASYQRFLTKVRSVKPQAIYAVEDYAVYFADIFYVIKSNVDNDEY